MPDWLVPFLVGTGSGGLVGYLLRAKVDDYFAQRRESRQFKREDLKVLRDALLEFLGPLRAHFSWLVKVTDPRSAGGKPSPDEKARLIGEWVYENAIRCPKEFRGSLYLIKNVAYQLAQDG